MFGALLEERVVRDPYWAAWGAGADITPTGDIRTIGTEQALRLLAVYSCVTFISDAISMLPIEVFRNKGRNRVKIDPAPRWLDMPNPEQSRQEFMGQSLASVLLTGNSYAFIIRDRFGQVVELWPLQPDQVHPKRAEPGAPVVYDITQRGFTGPPVGSDKVLHIKGFALPSDIVGRNPIADMRMSISTGIALEEFGAALFRNGVVPSAVIEAPPGAQVNASKLRAEAAKMHQGAKNAQGLMVLTGGAHYQQISINPDDAQFLESRNFTGAEIAAGVFGLHPEMIGLTHGISGGKDITYQNLESRWVELTRRALQKWITRFEFGFSNLLPGFATNIQYCKFNISEYLRADQLARYQAAQIALGGSAGSGKSWMTPDEVRDQEDLPPLEPDVLNPPAPEPVAAVEPMAAEPQRQDINVNVSTPDIIHVSPPNMRIETPVNVQAAEPVVVPAPVVNVEPAQVTVEAARAPDVHVAAADPSPVVVLPQRALEPARPHKENIYENKRLVGVWIWYEDKAQRVRHNVVRNDDGQIVGLEEA